MKSEVRGAPWQEKLDTQDYHNDATEFLNQQQKLLHILLKKYLRRIKPLQKQSGTEGMETFKIATFSQRI